MKQTTLLERSSNRWWLAILVIATIISCIGCSIEQTFDGFRLTVVTMPGDIYYRLPVTSSSPDELCFMIRDRDRKIAFSNSRSVVFGFAEETGLTLTNQADDLPEGYKPVRLLPAGEMLLRVRFRDSADEFSYNIIHSDNEGKEKLIFSDIRAVTGLRSVPPLCYGGMDELVLFVPDFQDGYTVWDAAAEPGDMQFISNVIAYGTGFESGNLTHVFVKADGQVLAYDPAARQADPDPDVQWLGCLANLCDISLNNNHEYRFTFASGVAAVRMHDQVLLVNDELDLFKVSRKQVLEFDYRGRTRTEQEIEAASKDFLFHRKEGLRVGVGVVGFECVTVPVDDTRLAVFDIRYQRLIIVEKYVGADELR